VKIGFLFIHFKQKKVMVRLFKSSLLGILTVIVLTTVVFGQAAKKGPRIKTIIIDAGHGGAEPGARGAYSTESQITLAIAKRLDTLLRSEMPTTRIVMTRETDVFHSVTEKANIANRENGDLFICIHVNAAPPKKYVTGYKNVTYYTGKGSKRRKHTKRQPIYGSNPNPMYGSSTYVWAADRSDNKAAGIVNDERFETEAEVADVPDPQSPEAIIKARLWTQKFFSNSVRLATMVENEFTNIGRRSLGVLQRNWKGIWVLQATNMPAILIETGYITNREEEDYLNSDAGQIEMTRAIANAILAYKQQVDGGK
jgi:N-acetylmuramoyl-L-alanine amidase